MHSPCCGTRKAKLLQTPAGAAYLWRGVNVQVLGYGAATAQAANQAVYNALGYPANAP